jgi:hypothetical protein
VKRVPSMAACLIGGGRALTDSASPELGRRRWRKTVETLKQTLRRGELAWFSCMHHSTGSDVMWSNGWRMAALPRRPCPRAAPFPGYLHRVQRPASTFAMALGTLTSSSRVGITLGVISLPNPYQSFVRPCRCKINICSTKIAIHLSFSKTITRYLGRKHFA